MPLPQNRIFWYQFPQQPSSLVCEPPLFHITSVLACSTWILFSVIVPQSGFCLNERATFFVCVFNYWKFGLTHYLLISLQPFRVCANFYLFTICSQKLLADISTQIMVLLFKRRIVLCNFWNLVHRTTSFFYFSYLGTTTDPCLCLCLCTCLYPNQHPCLHLCHTQTWDLVPCTQLLVLGDILSHRRYCPLRFFFPISFSLSVREFCVS